MLRLKFISEKSSLELMVETKKYQEIWENNKKEIIDAFYSETRLSFQQKYITVRVSNTQQSFSGSHGKPMILSAKNNYLHEYRRSINLLHELGHRLLTGNGLGDYALGYYDENKSELCDEISHRILYLFLKDVAEKCFPVESKYCYENERENPNGSHYKALAWVESLTIPQRKKILEAVTSRAIARDLWDTDWESKIQKTTPDKFIEYLDRLAE